MYMQITKELLTLCKKGDARAQQALYSAFKSTVMGLCRRYTRNREEAEDVFQETFIRVFRSIEQLNEVEKLEPWIKRIAVNAAVTYYHRNKRHYYHADYLDVDSQNEDYEMILSGLSDTVLVEVVNQLPDGYRMVFNMYVVEGYSHAEVGELLNISEATSRSQLNRARHVLQERLKALGIIKYERYA